MERTSETLISPAGAEWLWPIGASRLRQLSLAGRIPFRRVRGLRAKPARFYAYRWLRDRYGEPDADALAGLGRLHVFQMTSKGGMLWTLLIPLPQVETDDGDLAVSMEELSQ